MTALLAWFVLGSPLVLAAACAFFRAGLRVAAAPRQRSEVAALREENEQLRVRSGFR